MSIATSLEKTLPTVRHPKQCEACGQRFDCKIGLQACWCGLVRVSEQTRQILRAKYENCLCRTCLEKAEMELDSHELRVTDE